MAIGFLDALLATAQQREQQAARLALDDFRRDSLTEQVRATRRDEDLRGTLAGLQRKALERERERDRQQAAYQQEVLGVERDRLTMQGKGQAYEQKADSREIPVPAFLRATLGVAALPASAYGAAVSSAGQAYVAQQQAGLQRMMQSGANLNPENVRAVAARYQAGLGELGRMIESTDPMDADVRVDLLRQYTQLQEGLFGLATDPRTSRYFSLDGDAAQGAPSDPQRLQSMLNDLRRQSLLGLAAQGGGATTGSPPAAPAEPLFPVGEILGGLFGRLNRAAGGGPAPNPYGTLYR